jgi:hypothetical protein
MKCRWVVVIMLFMVVTIGGFGQAAAPAKPVSAMEQTLIAAEKSFIEAAKRPDVAFFKRTLANDFSFVDSDGQLYQRQDMINQRGDDWLDIRPYNIQVVTAGEDVAIVTYDAIVRVPPAEDQGPPPRYQHVSTVWVKQADAWKMKFQQTTAAHWGDW